MATLVRNEVRIIPTAEQLREVFDYDTETFIFPIDASIDLENRTVYGTTSPCIDLSMANVKFVHDTIAADTNKFFVSATAPAEMKEGDGWFNPVTGELRIYTEGE